MKAFHFYCEGAAYRPKKINLFFYFCCHKTDTLAYYEQNNKNHSIMNKSKLQNIISFTILSLALLFSASSCASNKNAQVSNAAIREVSVGNFTGISNSVVLTIHFTQGNKCSLKVKDPNNILLVSTKGGILTFKSKNVTTNVASNNEIEAWITAPRLTSIGNSGMLIFNSDRLNVSDIKISNNGIATYNVPSITATNMTLSNTGNFIFNKTSVSSDKMAIKNQGILNTELDCSKGNVSIENQGSIIASCNLTCQDISVSNQGNAEFKVTANAKTFLLKNYGKLISELNVMSTSMDIKNRGTGNDTIKFKGSDLAINNTGLSQTNLNVDCKELQASNSGMAKMTISGTADDTSFDSDGVININTS